MWDMRDVKQLNLWTNFMSNDIFGILKLKFGKISSGISININYWDNFNEVFVFFCLWTKTFWFGNILYKYIEDFTWTPRKAKGIWMLRKFVNFVLFVYFIDFYLYFRIFMWIENNLPSFGCSGVVWFWLTTNAEFSSFVMLI